MGRWVCTGAHLACRKSSLLKGLCLWPHLFRWPQQAWPPSPPFPPRGSKVKFNKWFRLIFLGPANWAGLNSARRASATCKNRMYVFLFYTAEWMLEKFWNPKSPPHVVLHLQHHTVAHLSEGVSCQNSCLSVNWCGEGQEKCHFWERRAHACGYSAWSFHYFCLLK